MKPWVHRAVESNLFILMPVVLACCCALYLLTRISDANKRAIRAEICCAGGGKQ